MAPLLCQTSFTERRVCSWAKWHLYQSIEAPHGISIKLSKYRGTTQYQYQTVKVSRDHTVSVSNCQSINVSTDNWMVRDLIKRVNVLLSCFMQVYTDAKIKLLPFVCLYYYAIPPGNVHDLMYIRERRY